MSDKGILLTNSWAVPYRGRLLENVYYSVGWTAGPNVGNYIATPEIVVESWKNSPGHRATMESNAMVACGSVLVNNIVNRGFQTSVESYGMLYVGTELDKAVMGGSPVPPPTPVLPPTPFPTFRPPTPFPTQFPTTRQPTQFPTTRQPTQFPTTKSPTQYPTNYPTPYPTPYPTKPPTKYPTLAPTTKRPTASPTKRPTLAPTTVAPTTVSPTESPTVEPTTTAITTTTTTIAIEEARKYNFYIVVPIGALIMTVVLAIIIAISVFICRKMKKVPSPPLIPVEEKEVRKRRRRRKHYKSRLLRNFISDEEEDLSEDGKFFLDMMRDMDDGW
jgi:hypothetical protein